MENTVYTHALWRVKPGRGQEFIEAWNGLSTVFARLPNPPIGTGTLIRSFTDPLLFYSFGPWKSIEDITAMRSDPTCREAIGAIIELCDEAQPGSYEVVAEVRM